MRVSVAAAGTVWLVLFWVLANACGVTQPCGSETSITNRETVSALTSSSGTPTVGSLGEPIGIEIIIDPTDSYQRDLMREGVDLIADQLEELAHAGSPGASAGGIWVTERSREAARVFQIGIPDIGSVPTSAAPARAPQQPDCANPFEKSEAEATFQGAQNAWAATATAAAFSADEAVRQHRDAVDAVREKTGEDLRELRRHALPETDPQALMPPDPSYSDWGGAFWRAAEALVTQHGERYLVAVGDLLETGPQDVDYDALDLSGVEVIILHYLPDSAEESVQQKILWTERFMKAGAESVTFYGRDAAVPPLFQQR